MIIMQSRKLVQFVKKLESLLKICLSTVQGHLGANDRHLVWMPCCTLRVMCFIDFDRKKRVYFPSRLYRAPMGDKHSRFVVQLLTQYRAEIL